MMRYLGLFLVLALLVTGCAGGPFDRLQMSDQEEKEPTAHMDTVEALERYDFAALEDAMRGDDWNLRCQAAMVLVQRADLSPEQKADLLLYGLEQEIENPSQGMVPSGVYLTPSQYARRYLGDKLYHLEPDILDLLRQRNEAASKDLQEHIQIALAYQGEDAAVSVVRGLLASDSVAVRMDAAAALAHLGDNQAMDDLERALQDPHAVVTRSCTRVYRIYPVREAAARALRQLGVEVERLEDDTFQVKK
ncbi:MAG: HEAT repeat domain-containing protein [Anaerolineae bacterium]